MALQIIRGVQPKAQKIVVYGPEGVGKTTFASKFPDPAFIDIEGGSSHYDVARLPTPKSWPELLQIVAAVKSERPCATLVVDTADWAERLCVAHMLKRDGKDSIESYGYGQGYTRLVEEFGKFLDALTDMTEAGVNALMLAHADVRKFEQPDELAVYDRWELKLSKNGQKKLAPLVKEWADAVLFLNFDQIIENVAKDGQSPKYKARGGKRVMRTAHNACWDAKNRWGLPDTLPLDFSAIAPHVLDMRPAVATQAPAAPPVPPVTPAAPVPPMPPAQPGQLAEWWEPLLRLLAPSGFTPKDVLDTAIALKHFPEGTALESLPRDYIEQFAIANWEKLSAEMAKLKNATDPIPF